MTRISNKTLIILILITLIAIGAGTWLLRSQISQPQSVDINAITPEESCTLEFEIFPVDTPTHLECRNEACVSVSGEGTNECNVDADCIEEEETHLECVNEACKEVSGSGENECDSDNDCKEETHMECRDEACEEVDGPGKEECDSDSDCREETHMECRNEACTEVTGDGDDECDSDSDCRETVIQPTPTPTPQVPVTGYTPQIGFLLLLLLTTGAFIKLILRRS